MYPSVLTFWFHELTPAMWWKNDPALDGLITERFGQLHAQAARGELVDWRVAAEGRLAEIIVLDQFSRNIYRDRPQAFAWDGMALVLAQEAIAGSADRNLTLDQRSFMYMPFMHSESLVIHEQAMRLFSAKGLETSFRVERRHKAILERFGRYPHRNAALDRESTDAEIAFLKEPGSSF